MSSSTCLSGRSYRIDLEIVKCASTNSTSTSTTNATSSPRTSQTSSPSSTLSESSSIAISTRKPRTPRKRPNQTYNEAAALLSTAYPNIFSSKSLSKPTKFSKPRETSISSSSSSSLSLSLVDESSELLLPFRVFDSSGFVLQQPACSFFPEPKMTNSMMMSPGSTTSTSNNNTNNASWEVDSHDNSKEICDDAYYREEEEDFHTESILDEEIGEGIDSIMGSLNLSVLHGPCSSNSNSNSSNNNAWCGNWINSNNIEGGRFQQQLGDRALRRGRNWFHFPVVDMLQISPRLKSNSGEVMFNININKNKNKKKKKKKKKKAIAELKKDDDDDDDEWVKVVENSINPNVAAAAANNTGGGLLLKLDYQEVLNAWSDRPAPFPHHISCPNGIHLSGRLAQMDLLTESGGMREASVLRYKEKRRTRLFSKKIRYQVRKVNADRRPRMKGRFVRRGNSSASHSRREE